MSRLLCCTPVAGCHSIKERAYNHIQDIDASLRIVLGFQLPQQAFYK